LILVSYGQNPAQIVEGSSPKLEFRNPKQVQMSQARMFEFQNFGFRISRRVFLFRLRRVGKTRREAGRREKRDESSQVQNQRWIRLHHGGRERQRVDVVISPRRRFRRIGLFLVASSLPRG
jgi:hypothetical protein